MWGILPYFFVNPQISFACFSLIYISSNYFMGGFLWECGWLPDWTITLLFLLILLLVYVYTKTNDSSHLHCMTLLTIFMGIFFSTSNGSVFFLSYEGMLFPIAALILMAGYEPERIHACLYMLLYTVLASLPLLIGGIFLINDGTWFLDFIKQKMVCWEFGVCLLLTFLVKLPIWGVHSWLPLAHVFSPLIGSIMLAGIMLKAGAYGTHLVLQMLSSRESFLFLLMSVAGVGSALCFFSGLINLDAKAIVAYSSVMHMAWVIIFLSWGGPLAELGVISLLLGHGISSPLLFSLVTNPKGSRSFMYLDKLPFFGISIFVIALAVSAGLPPSLNFISEVACFFSLGSLSTSMTVLFFLVFLLSGLYSLFIWISLHNSNKKVGELGLSFGDYLIAAMCIFFGLLIWL